MTRWECFFVPSLAVSLVGRRLGVFVCSLSGCLLSGTQGGCVCSLSLVGRRVGVYVCSLSGCLLSGMKGGSVCLFPLRLSP